MDFEKQIWDHCHKLFLGASNAKKDAQKYIDYYLGRFTNQDLYQEKNVKNSNNIVEQIVNTKNTALLDSQMTLTVVPVVTSFQDFEVINDSKNVADVYDDCLKQILRNNDFEKFKQEMSLWGDVTGFSPVETLWNPDMGKIGDVEIRRNDPRKFFWDKTAQTLKDCSYLGFEMEISPMILKKKYAVKEDGTYDDEMAKKIDALVGMDGPSTSSYEQTNAVTSNQSDQTTGLAYTKRPGDTKGLKHAGKSVKLIKMYLKDDSTFTPDDKDDNKTKDTKEFLKFAYPKGRVIILSASEEHKIVFKDDALPDAFQEAFNVDVFNPMYFDDIQGKGDVESLIPIQDRLTKAYERLRTLIAKYVSIICLDKGYDIDIGEGDLVNNFVTFFENLKTRGIPQVLTNNTLAEIQNIINYITMLKTDAKEIARVNDTMISGRRQPGTTSAAQVEALQEDPQASIRAMQRNFRDTLISIGNKCLSLIQEYYDLNRIQKLTTGIMVKTPPTPEAPQGGQTQAQFAKFNNNKEIDLLDQAGKAIQTIKSNPDFKFQVEIIAGTEIPRSRTQTSQLMQQLFTQNLLGDQGDPEVIEQYFKAMDVPNYHAYVKKLKQADEQKAQQPPTISQTLGPDNMVKLITSLRGYSKATQKLLEELQLDPTPDNIETAPFEDKVKPAEMGEALMTGIANPQQSQGMPETPMPQGLPPEMQQQMQIPQM